MPFGGSLSETHSALAPMLGAVMIAAVIGCRRSSVVDHVTVWATTGSG